MNTLTKSLTPIAYEKELIAYDPINKIFSGRHGFQISFLQSTPPFDPYPTKGITQEDELIKAPQHFWSIVKSTPSQQTEFLNIQTGMRKTIGVTHTDKQRGHRAANYAVSPTGRHFFSSFRKKAEVFWVSELEKEKPKTWVFEIPFE